MAAIILWALLYAAGCWSIMRMETKGRKLKRQRKNAPGSSGHTQNNASVHTAASSCNILCGRELQQDAAGTPEPASSYSAERRKGESSSTGRTLSTKKEWAAELTWKIPCLKRGYLQPALHLIRNDVSKGLAGLIRFGYRIA